MADLRHATLGFKDLDIINVWDVADWITITDAFLDNIGDHYQWDERTVVRIEDLVPEFYPPILIPALAKLAGEI